MRVPILDIDRNSTGAVAPDEIADLLEAAEELESLLGAEQGVVVRELIHLLRRQTAFAKLNAQFGKSIEASVANHV